MPLGEHPKQSGKGLDLASQMSDEITIAMVSPGVDSIVIKVILTTGGGIKLSMVEWPSVGAIETFNMTKVENVMSPLILKTEGSTEMVGMVR